MKLIALAAALAMGAPAIAQTTTGTADQTTTTTTDQTTTDTTTTATTTDQDPLGGYQPSAPPLSGTPQPGQEVIFKPSPSPDVAFPPPAPLQEYPVCKKGQTDNCRQRGG